ncbi:MAG: hypothetical protein C0408_10115 [Odoribacter sp.]|nr:hypothetical protein [Odoribacter sp.]
MISTFSIVTTYANELMAGIHNSAKRMPVILDKQSENKWINLETDQKDALMLLSPCQSDILRAHTISDLVSRNSAERNTIEVIKPYKWDIEGTLF